MISDTLLSYSKCYTTVAIRLIEDAAYDKSYYAAIYDAIKNSVKLSLNALVDSEVSKDIDEIVKVIDEFDYMSGISEEIKTWAEIMKNWDIDCCAYNEINMLEDTVRDAIEFAIDLHSLIDFGASSGKSYFMKSFEEAYVNRKGNILRLSEKELVEALKKVSGINFSAVYDYYRGVDVKKIIKRYHLANSRVRNMAVFALDSV